jgi:glycosyltransferase involved in cell wall biosynthesis
MRIMEIVSGGGMDGATHHCLMLTRELVRRGQRQEADRLGVNQRLIWAGLRSDIPEIMAALDLFVMPSLEEAQGVAPLEASHHAKPRNLPKRLHSS